MFWFSKMQFFVVNHPTSRPNFQFSFTKNQLFHMPGRFVCICICRVLVTLHDTQYETTHFSFPVYYIYVEISVTS